MNNVHTKQKNLYYCPRCGAEVTKVPISDYREKGKLWHIPHFGKARCDKCNWVSKPFGGGLKKG